MTSPFTDSDLKAATLAGRLLSIKEAAEYLGVSERTVYTFTKSEGLPHVRLGRLVKYVPSDLRAWVQARRQTIGES